jgi:hypothetical protein
MRRVVAFAAALLWLAAVTAPPCAAHPEHVDELWRSPYGVIRSDSPLWTRAPLSAAVNPTDGSVWLTAGANLMHLAEDGTLLFRSEALYAPFRVAVDPADGSCWVLEGLSYRVLHFAADGRLLSATPCRLEGGAEHPMYNWLTPSPADGSVWVTGWFDLARIDATGAEVWRSSYMSRYISRYDFVNDGSFQAVVDPNDGSAWTLDGGEVVRVRPDGSEVWRVSGLGLDRVLDEDPRDQSVWTVLSGQVAHISSEGAVVGQASSERAVSDLHVSPLDGSVWVTYYDRPPPTAATAEGEDSSMDVVHLDSSGAELWRFPHSRLFAYSDYDGSVWVQTWDSDQEAVLVHLSAAHEELHRLPYRDSFTDHFVAHNSADNSFWVEDRESKRLLHLGPDGTVLWEDRVVQLYQLWGATGWVDPEDGSCWVLDRAGFSAEADELVQISSDGTEVGRRTWPDDWPTPQTMSISPFDSSWWVVCGEEGSWTATLLHLASDGTELWRREGGLSNAIAVDEDDGSLWLLENSYVGWDNLQQGRLYRLTADGNPVWVSEFGYWLGPAAIDPNDGSAWVLADDPAGRKLIRFARAGAIVAEIPLPDSLAWTSDLAVLESDGSIYAVGQAQGPAIFDYEGWVSRIGSDGTIMWVRDGFVNPTSAAVDPRNGSVWVVDAGTQSNDFSPGSAVVHLGADGTEMWRGETFNLPQAVELDARDGSVWVSDWRNGQVVHLRVVLSPFSDVPGDFWSFHEILACMEAGIVFGYGEDHYEPSLTVTRDQMAAYIARGLAGGDAHVPTGPATASFPDVPPTHWAYRYVEYCHDQGVVQGYEDGYRPDEAVSRAQIAVYVARALAGGESNVPEDPDGTPVFPDVGTDHWAYKHVEYCHDREVVRGYWDGYHPDEVVNRAQMAVYVQRAFDLPM